MELFFLCDYGFLWEQKTFSLHQGGTEYFKKSKFLERISRKNLTNSPMNHDEVSFRSKKEKDEKSGWKKNEYHFFIFFVEFRKINVGWIA